MIPYSRQNIDDSDLAALREVLFSDFLTTGPLVPRFERAVAEFCGAPHAIAVSSCTAALHLAMLALGVGDGDLVYVSAISFAASANCARYVGAEVEFVDVDPRTGNLDMSALSDKLEQARCADRLPKAVVAVDLSGRPVELDALKNLKEQYGFKLVEDAAHALGAEYHGRRIGCCEISDITVLSFHPVKIITTAEGGMCLCRDPLLAQTLCDLRAHGITRDRQRLRHKDLPAFYYEQHSLGFNYRLNDLQAALGLNQMQRLPDFLTQRRAQAASYPELLQDIPGLKLPRADDESSQSSWHLYQVGLPPELRNLIFEEMRNAGIGVQVHYLPIYRHPYYEDGGHYRPLPGAEAFFAATLSLPLYPGLAEESRIKVADTLRRLLARD